MIDILFDIVLSHKSQKYFISFSLTSLQFMLEKVETKSKSRSREHCATNSLFEREKSKETEFPDRRKIV